MKNMQAIILPLLLTLSLLAGCGGSAPQPAAAQTTDPPAAAAVPSAAPAPAETAADAGQGTGKVATAADMTTVEDVVEEGMVPVFADQLREGTYSIRVDSSSSMFQITDCTLTVAEGEMTAEMVMGGKGYLYIYPGTAEQAAAAEAAAYISFEEGETGAHTFTLPVEALDAGVACAAFSKNKELWYDRTLVFRADSLPPEAFAEGFFTTAESLGLADGSYLVEVALSGGSGRASVESPAVMTAEGGACTARIVWSSSNYDYMRIGEARYLPVNTEGNSVFEIPVQFFDRSITVYADTTAMSTPHEIEYTLTFDGGSILPVPVE